MRWKHPDPHPHPHKSSRRGGGIMEGGKVFKLAWSENEYVKIKIKIESAGHSNE